MEKILTQPPISAALLIWELLETIPDPEIPVLSIVDLGIIRDVVIEEEAASKADVKGVVIFTPTYTGCPAMDMITMQIRILLLENGYKQMRVKQVLSPAWSTDSMTESGKEKLKAYGIAPPHLSNIDHPEKYLPACPQCQSPHTRLISEFGSTACKALYQCEECKEPFDFFKCH